METLEHSKLYEIIGSPTLKESISKLTQNLHIKIIDIMNLFQVQRINQIKIFLYDNEQDFQNVTKYPYRLGPLAGAYNSYAIRAYGDLNKITIDDLFKCIIHEIVHIIYDYYVLEPKKEPKLAWLDEGLAQNISGEKEYLKDNKNLRNFMQKHIFDSSKIIPNINYLKNHGNKFGEFIDRTTNLYNGYAWSYLIVRYLIETKTKKEFMELIQKPSQINELEKTLINDTLNYYKERLEVDNYDQMDTRANRSHI